MMNRCFLFKLLIIFLFLLVGFVSIGYSSFNTNLSISGDAIVRRESLLRIDNLVLVSKNNGGSEVYNSSYSKSLVSMSVNLLNTNSSVVYRVDVINKTGHYFTVNSIVEKAYSNKNVKYEISGLEVNKVYQGTIYSFNITFTSLSDNQSCNLLLSFDFSDITKTEWTYSLASSFQTFSSLYNATYKIEAWGAQGGKVTASSFVAGSIGGNGGYVSGNLDISKDAKLYVYVGGSGVDGDPTSRAKILIAGGYNGGGSNGSFDALSPGGGGATDIRTTSGNWDDVTSLRSRIMVAGGGGGSGLKCAGAAGGINSGIMASLYGGNGTMTSGGASGTGYTHYAEQLPGSFGKGGQGGYYGIGAGGAGYYGGGGGAHVTPSTSGGGGGGSSFVSGCSTCNSVNSSGNHTGSPNHFSGYVFSNIVMIDGTKNMPTHNGSGTMVGNSGDGFVKITLIPAN